MPKWLQENNVRPAALWRKICNGFKSPLRRLRPYHLYITRALAGLLNLWDLAVQTMSRQPLSQSAWMPSRSSSGGLWILELGVKIPRKGYLMP